MNKIKLGVIYGGLSTEHEVSINSAKSVIDNLDKDKYDIYKIYIDKKGEWYKEDNKIDNVFDYLRSLDVVFPFNMFRVLTPKPPRPITTVGTGVAEVFSPAKATPPRFSSNSFNFSLCSSLSAIFLPLSCYLHLFCHLHQIDEFILL